MSKYYYLVAGLPELTLEDSKLSYTVADFKTEIYPELSSSHRQGRVSLLKRCCCSRQKRFKMDI